MSTPSRPQPRQTPSAIVRDFTHNVDGAFHLSNSDSINEEAQISNLAHSVEEKKRVVDSELRELEELKAKIRETEQRLERAAASGGGASAGAQEARVAHVPTGTSRIPRAAAHSSPKAAGSSLPLSSPRSASGVQSQRSAPAVEPHATTIQPSHAGEVKAGPYIPGQH